MTEGAVEYRSIYDFPVTFIVYTTKGDFKSEPVEWDDRIVSHSFGLPTGVYVNRWVAAHPDGTILQERTNLVDYIAAGQKYTIVLGGSESPGHPGVTDG